MAIADLFNRLGIGVVGALALHGVLILGIGFGFNLNPIPDLSQQLDVVLVNWRSETAPEQADYLAQVNQRGGSEVEALERPTAPETAMRPEPVPETATTPSVSAAPEATPQRREVVTASESPVISDSAVTEVEAPARELPTAQDLMADSRQLARMAPEFGPRRDIGSHQRKKFISANTREFEAASYMSAWVRKVERIGNLNYPQAARQRGLNGDLLLMVGIYQDGSLESITVKRSSGHPMLDEAARHIVRLAAPYTPLPPELAQQTDILYITRTWRFSPSNRLE